MQIRRPVASVLTALALLGAGGLTSCANNEPSRTGTPLDQAELTTGNDPSSDRQGNLPMVGQRPAGSEETRGGVGGGGQQGGD